MRPSKTLLLCLPLLAAACRAVPAKPDYGRPLPDGAPALIPLRDGERRPDLQANWADRHSIRISLERSIDWTDSNYARQFFPMAGITHERALASLLRFREILDESRTARDFELTIERDFTIYKSAGWDGEGGGVLYTGYCTPILEGRLRPDAEYRFPLYALPEDLVKDNHGAILGQIVGESLRPYPTRATIEASAMLSGKGLELVWLRDRIDAYIAHINGSAFINVGTGELLRLGYAGKNGRDYTSLGKELVADRRLTHEEVSLMSIRRWASENSEEVQSYLERNDSFVFFARLDGNPRGSLNLEVQTERTLATDKSLFPRGALVFVETRIPVPGKGERRFEKIMLDQDTGGAIRTAGRADIYLGIGPQAELSAGTTRSEGQLYYLFLRE